MVFASCKDPREFWVPIVEKGIFFKSVNKFKIKLILFLAYAKLHGSYSAIESGSISDGTSLCFVGFLIFNFLKYGSLLTK